MLAEKAVEHVKEALAVAEVWSCITLRWIAFIFFSSMSRKLGRGKFSLLECQSTSAGFIDVFGEEGKPFY